MSHVCHRWREVALDAHILWTTLEFERRPRLDWARMYIARSGELRLNIHIYCVLPKGANEADHPDHPLYYENKALQKKSIREGLAAEHGEEDTSQADEMYDGDNDANAILFLSQQDLEQILDLIEPTVSRWSIFSFKAGTSAYIHLFISRLHALPSAPLLEKFQMYDFRFGDNNDYQVLDGDDETGFLPFHGDAPLLKEVTLWSVYIDWDAALPSFLRGLHVFKLYFQNEDFHPSYKTFTQIINNSPDLFTLCLAGAGPALADNVTYDTDITDGGWGTTPLTIPSVVNLMLQFHDPKYASALAKHLDVPNVTGLVLDFGGEDYSEFVGDLLNPVKGRTENLLRQIEHMAIGGLPCNVYKAEALLGQLVKLKSLNIKTKRKVEEKIIVQKLAYPYAGRSSMGLPAPGINANTAVEGYQQQYQQDPAATTLSSNTPLPALFCPCLESLITYGVPGKEMKELLRARLKLGVPLKRVLMSQEDTLSTKEERWIREHVEEFKLLEPPNSEDYSDVDEDENGENGVDGNDDG